MPNHNYSFTVLQNTPEYIYIQDNATTGPPFYMSVTNAAEDVIEELWKQGSLSSQKRLFYKDTEGQIDELIHVNGVFKGFKAGHEGIKL